jgi:hypothetical protein
MAEASARSDEALPGELESLVEPLAIEVHLAWMQAKQDQDWTLGPLDREARTHPDLIPFDQLPGDTKHFDRTTVRAVFRGLDRLGYSVVRRLG